MLRLSVLILCLFWYSMSLADQAPIEDRIRALEPVIGMYPPHIDGEVELKTITASYQSLKSELDVLLAKDPANQQLLFLRGHLQSMGHNFDYPGAWQGATTDLKAILEEHPDNIPALLELGELWVNSDGSLAAGAEKLFIAAQCYTGKQPLEIAQRGIFFALYYQGRLQEAYAQVTFLAETWPDQQIYKHLQAMTQSVIERSEAKPLLPEILAMTSCHEVN